MVVFIRPVILLPRLLPNSQTINSTGFSIFIEIDSETKLESITKRNEQFFVQRKKRIIFPAAEGMVNALLLVWAAVWSALQKVSQRFSEAPSI